MDHLKTLKQIRTELVSERDILRKELRNYPNASLTMFQDHGYIRKIMITDKNLRRSIGRDHEMVRKLARRAFLLAYLNRIDSNVALLDDTISDYWPEDAISLLKELPRHFDSLPLDHLLSPAVKQYRKPSGPLPDPCVPLQPAMLRLDGIFLQDWKVLPYRPNTKHAENKINRTTGGLLVRSKSEASILELYDRYDIPYHYDEVLDFGALLQGRRDTGDPAALAYHGPTVRSPDIHAARRDGKLFIHEHFGKPDDPQYAGDMQNKLELYCACGFVPWDNLIITFDEPGGGIDLQLVEAQLRNKGLI